MNIQELMHAVPQPIVEIIIKYTLEFHRADAIERTLQFRSMFDTSMKQICEDVRMNTAKCHMQAHPYGVCLDMALGGIISYLIVCAYMRRLCWTPNWRITKNSFYTARAQPFTRIQPFCMFPRWMKVRQP